MTGDRKQTAFDADETEALRAIGWRQSAEASSCPDSALLIAAEEGIIDQAAAARVRDHVAHCAMCRQLAKDLSVVLAEEPGEDVAARIRALVTSSAVPPLRRPLPYVWIGAGGLALAAGLLWFFIMPKSVQAPPLPETEIARATPPPAPSVFVLDWPAIPPGDVDLAVRGEAAKTSLEDKIGAAFDRADKGDLPGAASDLRSIAGQNKLSRMAALAYGAIQLRLGLNADAMTTLERARSLKGDQETGDEVGWFLGIALVRTGSPVRARAILDEVCRHGGARGPAACAGVAEIDRNKPQR